MLEALTDILEDEYRQVLDWNHPSIIKTQAEEICCLEESGERKDRFCNILTIDTSHPDFLKLEIILPDFPDQIMTEEVDELMQIPGSTQVSVAEGTVRLILQLTSMSQVVSQDLDDLFFDCLGESD